MSGSDVQTQMAIDAGVLNVLPQLMRHPKASVQKEAAWALSNIAAGPCKQIQQLITCGLLSPLVEQLRNVSSCVAGADYVGKMRVITVIKVQIMGVLCFKIERIQFDN